jgi:hypothetical protein
MAGADWLLFFCFGPIQGNVFGMMKGDSHMINNELTSLNPGLVNFDLDDLTIEDLERRMELALGIVSPAGCDCPT